MMTALAVFRGPGIGTLLLCRSTGAERWDELDTAEVHTALLEPENGKRFGIDPTDRTVSLSRDARWSIGRYVVE